MASRLINMEKVEILAHCLLLDERGGWSGDVYISTITGAEEIEDVKFRWESWDAGNGYAGPRAASDHEYIKQSVKRLVTFSIKHLYD